MQRSKLVPPDYIQALEEERCKIQMFSKELPLSLELVTQAIEAYRQELSGSTTKYDLNAQPECSEQTTLTEAPVLEEFIPIKRRASSYCNEDERHSQKQNISKENNNNDKRKSDWLRSVQLWNPDPPTEEGVTGTTPVMELRRSGSGGGAFQPFHKEERAPSSTQVAATSSMAVTNTKAGSSKKKEKEGQRKQRRCWSEELHKRFLHAFEQLGGANAATPKQIREIMDVDGLTNDEVKSHLQKYRLHTRRPSPTAHEGANSQTTPFVLLGNIIIQPAEYAAVATSTTSTELTEVAAPARIYAPVATRPSAVSTKGPEFQRVGMLKHSNSKERANDRGEGAVVHSNSPSSSCSSHTITTSRGY